MKRSRSISWIALILLSAALSAQESQPAPKDGKPLDPAEVEATAVKLLTAMQESYVPARGGKTAENKAEWPYEGVYREGGEIPIGYRVGGTAIAAMALLESKAFGSEKTVKSAVDAAVRFVLKGLDDPMMTEAFNQTYDVRGWGHAYALELLLRLEEKNAVPADLAGRTKAAAEWLTKTLMLSAIPETGGWNYSRPRGYRSPKNGASPFMTSPTLMILFHAASRGYRVDATVLENALDALERARNENGGYDYTAPVTKTPPTPTAKLTMMDKLPGSIGRMVATESALTLAGRGDQKRLRGAIDAFFDHWGALEVRRKQNGTHIPPYGVAPYYFMYAHYFAAVAIELLDDASAKPALRERLNITLASVREADGGWNDRVFARSEGFGTAMAMLAIKMKELTPPAKWKPEPKKP